MNDNPAAQTALLIVDMQATFLQTCHAPEVLEKRTALALRGALACGLSIAFTEQVPDKLGPTLPSLRQLAPDAPTFAKTSFSALRAPDLAAWLEDRAISHLLLAGIETPICIYQTALDALNQDIGITLLSDATGGRRPEDIPPIHAMLRQHACAILPVETIFFSLLADATHPQFRTWAKTVKAHF